MSAQVESYMRPEPGSHNIPIGVWPPSAQSTPSQTEVNQIANDMIKAFNAAVADTKLDDIAVLFHDNSYWRDHLATSWNFRTLKGKDQIANFLRKGGGSKLKSLEIDNTSAFRSPQMTALDAVGEVTGIQFFVKFTTVLGSGRGLVKLSETDGKWGIWTLYLALKELKGYEEPLNSRRARGVQHGGQSGRKTWLENRVVEGEFEGENEPAVLIIGAGQGGLTAAARLKMLNVPTLVFDANDRVGDNWRRRYDQLVLHDPVWFDHMPYLPFPAHWPIFTPKDKLGDWFEAYVAALELNVWTKTTMESASWNDSQRSWTVKLCRTKADGTSESRTLHPRHIIQATGHSGPKALPKIPGMNSFDGHLLCHSSDFPGARNDAVGKKAVVVGACNSAHDICQDFFEKGYDVTMVQRSSTCVVSSASITNIGLAGLYDENGPPTDDADLWLHGAPSEILKGIQVKVSRIQADSDKEILDGLRKAGFMTDLGPDDSGLLIKYFQRGGGYYIDVGASQLIADGKIKVKSGQEIQEIVSNGLKFVDGSELEADEIIFATGYENMRSRTRDLFGDEIADRVGDIWGFDEEGEMRTIWRKSGHPGLWFNGGNLALSRFYSGLLALQIKAIEAGLCKYEDDL